MFLSKARNLNSSGFHWSVEGHTVSHICHVVFMDSCFIWQLYHISSFYMLFVQVLWNLWCFYVTWSEFYFNLFIFVLFSIRDVGDMNPHLFFLYTLITRFIGKKLCVQGPVVADPELFIRGEGTLTALRGGPLRSCISYSLYNQPIFPTNGDLDPQTFLWIRLCPKP